MNKKEDKMSEFASKIIKYTAMALLFFVTVELILYAADLKRPEIILESTDNTDNTEAENNDSDINSSTDSGEIPEGFEAVLASLTDLNSARNNGYTERNITYTQGSSMLAYSGIISGNVSKEFGTGGGTVPQVTLYGGHIIYTDVNGGKFLIDQEGNTITDITGYELVYMRNTTGYSVFKYNDGYFIFDDKEMVPCTDYILQPLSFNYNSLYGRAHCDRYPFKDDKTGLWGYKDGAGNIVIPASFVAAYNFSDNGLAMTVYRKSGRMIVIDAAGNQVINLGADNCIYFYMSQYNVRDWFMPPATNGIEAIGMYYFDHGFTRVRRCIVENQSTLTSPNNPVVLADNQALLDQTGHYYSLPEGYELIGYSDGIALLTGNGSYGYYSCVANKWIAEPIYSYAQPFSGGLGVIGYAGGKVGAVDTNGNWILPMNFDYISGISEDRLTAYESSTGWMMFYLTGKPQ